MVFSSEGSCYNENKLILYPLHHIPAKKPTCTKTSFTGSKSGQLNIDGAILLPDTCSISPVPIGRNDQCPIIGIGDNL